MSSSPFSALFEDETGAQRYFALGDAHVLFDKLPLSSLSELKAGEVLELRGTFHEMTPNARLALGLPGRDSDTNTLRGMAGVERERFITYGIRLGSGELCVDLPRHTEYPIAIVKAARIVSEDDVPDAALAKIKTAEAEANPPAESLAKMGDALEDLLR